MWKAFVKEVGVNDISLCWQRQKAPWNQKIKTKQQTKNWPLIRGIVLLIWLEVLCSQAKSLQLDSIPTLFFERWASSFLTSVPRHHRETFSRALCSDRACHSLVVSGELIWTDGFSLWLPEMMKTFLEGRISTDQWSDIPLAHWTESLFSEALGESCLLTLNWGMLVVWWEREKDWIFFSCPWHCCFFALFSEVSLGQGFSASFRKCRDLIFLSMFSHGRYCICCEELVWERLRGTIYSRSRCSWYGLDREERSVLLWIAQNCIPDCIISPCNHR